MKCASCKQTIQETFLGKIVGTHVKDAKGKRYPVCDECQRGFTKEQLQERF